MTFEMVRLEDSIICALDKLKLAVPFPKPRCILGICDFYAVNTIFVANGQLKWLPVTPSTCLCNSGLPWFCMQSSAAASGAMTLC